MKKLITFEEAVGLIKDGDTIAASGFMLATVAREMMVNIGESFQETGHPKDLTVYQGAGIGNNKDQGTYEYSFKGAIKRYVTGHYANNQRMIEMVNNNEVESYNFPQGVISHLYRQRAGGKDFEITQIGLKTYCDPRLSGGKMNEKTTEDLVELIEIDGKEYLKYKAPMIDVGIIRGTTSDEFGNITMEEESAYIDALDIAMAAKASGGKVIAQVKNIVSSSSIDRQQVVVPGVFVDAVVQTTNPEEYHRQTPGSFYDPLIAGHYKSDLFSFKDMNLDARKVIARRAAMECKEDIVVNLGIGIPEGVASVANEEGLSGMVLTIESGLIGGFPLGGFDFGSAVNSWAGLPMTSQFDYYNHGGLDITFLGFAEVNPMGDINVSRFGSRIAGCGGFIDITQSTKNIVFCGTLTAGGLEVAVEDGKLKIIQEGRRKKFLPTIEQVTYSAEFGLENGQNVLFITERCVFKPSEKGLVLVEVAPGIDIQKDIIDQMDFKPIIADNVETMDERLFKNALMGLANNK
ncbi:MAG: propionate CoA-transferase [Eubacteriaceae bacterium]|jgi:propionate CoA-transferase|nr:propionate CoA-transferase [Eubacteriaceae bacterium]